MLRQLSNVIKNQLKAPKASYLGLFFSLVLHGIIGRSYAIMAQWKASSRAMKNEKYENEKSLQALLFYQFRLNAFFVSLVWCMEVVVGGFRLSYFHLREWKRKWHGSYDKII